jgi:hypothetical protein
VTNCATTPCLGCMWLQEDSLPGGLPQFPSPGESGDLLFE